MMTLSREKRINLAARRLHNKDLCDIDKGQRCLAINTIDDPLCIQCLADYQARITMDRTGVDE